MTNAEKFKHLFGIYATELWAMPENDFLEWLNADAQDMPTAERKTGKWIVENNPGTGWYRVICSECGEDVTSTALCIGFYPNAKVTWDYCPNCGADMRGDQNED